MSTEERIEYWVSVIEDCESSGLSISQYCRNHKIPKSNYFQWRKKIRDNAINDNKIDFVSIDIIREEKQEIVVESNYDNHISLSIKGIEFNFSENTNPSLMKKLLEVLEYDI